MADDNPLRTPHSALRTPLGGLRVLDLTEGIAGPWCAMQLGDAGADVVKVEPPEGDHARRLGPPFLEEEGVLFLALNRNKRSVVLDLETPAGRTRLRALIGKADVLLHDRTPAEASALELDYRSTRPLNERLVYCALTAFGPEGPLRDLPGAELVIQAMAEYTASLGAIGAPPVRLGADVANAAGAFFAFQAILAALIARERTGHGQAVAASLFGALLHLRGILWSSRSDPDAWYGFHLDSYTKPPDHGYRAADRALYFSLGRGSAEDWDRLLAELDLFDALNDPRFADCGREAVGIGRWAHEVKPVWEAAFARRSAEEIIRLVRSVHGNAVPLMTYPDLAADRQVAHLGIFTDVEHPAGGTFRTVGIPWHLSETLASIRRRPPRLGEHTAEVLAEWV